MDSSRFDALTRRLASGSSRRAMVKVTMGAVIGGLVGSAPFGNVNAAAKRKFGQTCKGPSDCEDPSQSCIIASDGRRRCLTCPENCVFRVTTEGKTTCGAASISSGAQPCHHSSDCTDCPGQFCLADFPLYDGYPGACVDPCGGFPS